ncbi:MAG TPA: hypothetical protein VHZ73_08410 [Vicinamibacterales bacterium]|jgi:hypothetical protein|nr:hypothetical protein [Vicinamibacterales bacterium]
MTFRAGDTVKHTPTGEMWILACDQEDNKVLPAGWPESLAKATDCALVEAATDAERLAMLTNAAISGGYRGAVASSQFAALVNTPAVPAGPDGFSGDEASH